MTRRWCQEAAREALAKEFSGFSNASQQVADTAKTKAQTSSLVGGLNEWELAELHKRFNALQEKKNRLQLLVKTEESGCATDIFATGLVVSSVRTWQVYWDICPRGDIACF